MLPSEESRVLDKDPLGPSTSGPRCVRVFDTGEPIEPKNPPSEPKDGCSANVATNKLEMPECQTWPDGNENDAEPLASGSSFEHKSIHWNLYKIFTELDTPVQCINFAEERGLIPKMKICSYHKKPMLLHCGRGLLGVFRCRKRNCRRESISRAAGTWFEHARIPLSTIFQIMYMYSWQFSYYQVQLETAGEKVLSSSTIADWFACCRETIIVYHLEHQNAEHKIGGPGKIVYIEKSKFGERKFSSGRHIVGQWVLGMMEKGSDDLRLEVCPDNDESATVLLPMIVQKHVQEGTEIHTNSWIAYHCLSQHGFSHKTINHSISVNKSEEPEAHSQPIDSHWRKLKALFKRDRYKGNFTDWLIEYSWRRNIRLLKKDAFEELLKAVKYSY